MVICVHEQNFFVVCSWLFCGGVVKCSFLQRLTRMGCCCVVARRAVSQKKRRTVYKGVPNGAVDLDLVQVHRHIVCMGFPAVRLDSLYRNSYTDVVRYLDHVYGENYMVYNLCAEQKYRYDVSLFHSRVCEYPFLDHTACPLMMIPNFVNDAVQYIEQKRISKEAVVVIHCKAGKGRTGLLTCCLLMSIEPSLEMSAAKAMEYYGIKRTVNGRGVTIPSQKRYIEYYEGLLRQYGGHVPLDVPNVKIFSIQLRHIKAKNGSAPTSCKWYACGESCVVSLMPIQGNDFSVFRSAEGERIVDLTYFPFFQKLSHDVRVELLDGKRILGVLTFHVLFIRKEYAYTEIDGICKSKLPEDAGISLEFELLKEV